MALERGAHLFSVFATDQRASHSSPSDSSSLLSESSDRLLSLYIPTLLEEVPSRDQEASRRGCVC